MQLLKPSPSLIKASSLGQLPDAYPVEDEEEDGAEGPEELEDPEGLDPDPEGLEPDPDGLGLAGVVLPLGLPPDGTGTDGV